MAQTATVVEEKKLVVKVINSGILDEGTVTIYGISTATDEVMTLKNIPIKLTK